ncbi:peptidoglycan-binding protein [Streptomyces sp. NBC_00654]|uniref:peptidoglycan-binding protein n=1 Tax=Streptomyces sp. NBC_00654 TaxID=2975799 RepID=UPI00225BF313|nr:peptidoglycan-binding protein [Streptomyces sp. NBC_00654]MCX4966865.1 peptidoglycan-binding protein [Streptomyces sp. NBC_00654]
MAQEPGGQGREHGAGEQLAMLLRRWWEESGKPPGGTRPTQQALALRLGVDQTTLSRYLNPRHVSVAPLNVVETLHALLCAPAVEREQARALWREAARESGRQKAAGGTVPTPAPVGAREGEATAAAPDPAAEQGTDGSGARVRRRGLWLRPFLGVAALAVAFTAGGVVHEQFFAQHLAPTANGAAGAAATREEPREWPIMSMGVEDQFTRARALQYLLNGQGYEIRADGFIGEETRDAVMDFQLKKNLPVDGKVGRLTWPELVPDVGPGAETFEVRAVQELLNNAGLGGTTVSGKYTAATAADVGFFQARHHLPATGRVDMDTWLALLVEQDPPLKRPEYQRDTGPLPSDSV